MTKPHQFSWLQILRTTLEKLLNGAIFYVAWLVCILFAASNEENWALLLSFLLLILHFMVTKVRRKDAILMVSLIGVGFVMDTIYVQSGMIRFSSPNPISEAIAPLWILSIWAIFGVTLNHSMWWLKNRYILAAFLGAWGGTVSYIAGERLGAATFVWPYEMTTMVLVGVWFFLLPVIMWWASWVDRHVH